MGGATIEQRRNDEQLECSVVSFNGDERTSASIGFIAPFDKHDKSSVVAVDDYAKSRLTLRSRKSGAEAFRLVESLLYRSNSGKKAIRGMRGA